MGPWTRPLLLLLLDPYSPAQVFMHTAVQAHILSLESINADREVSSLRQIWECMQSAHFVVQERDSPRVVDEDNLIPSFAPKPRAPNLTKAAGEDHIWVQGGDNDNCVIITIITAAMPSWGNMWTKKVKKSVITLVLTTQILTAG